MLVNVSDRHKQYKLITVAAGYYRAHSSALQRTCSYARLHAHTAVKVTSAASTKTAVVLCPSNTDSSSAHTGAAATRDSHSDSNK
jgi:hypothetical protein